jgi:hypothetical protein
MANPVTTLTGRINTARIVDALMIAGLTAAITSYATLSAIEKRVDLLEQNMERRIDTLNRQLDTLRSDLYVPRSVRNGQK